MFFFDNRNHQLNLRDLLNVPAVVPEEEIEGVAEDLRSLVGNRLARCPAAELAQILRLMKQRTGLMHEVLHLIEVGRTVRRFANRGLRSGGHML